MNSLLVNTSVVPLLAEPRLSGGQVSQLVLGEGATILESTDSFLRVRTFLDQYEGWLHRGYAELLPAGEAEAWLVTAAWSEGALLQRRDGTLMRAPHRARLMLERDGYGYLPGGEVARIVDGEIRPYGEIIRDCGSQPPEEWAWSEFAGTPYLWGGVTASGIDCSGLVQLTFIMRGVPLPRDARDQVGSGTVVAAGTERPGDLLFFRGRDSEAIAHVAFLAGDDEIVHATVDTGCVTRESWSPGSRAAALRERLVAVRRLT